MNRSDKHIDLTLGVVRNFWRKNRDLRLCQLIVNANESEDPYNVEDGALVEQLSGEPMLHTQPLVEDQPVMKAGDRFKKVSSSGVKNYYRIRGFKNHEHSFGGVAFLESEEPCVVYVGDLTPVRDLNHITVEEFQDMAKGHTFVKEDG